MKFEKLEITNVYAISKDTTSWTVHIAVSNTGSADAVITIVTINGVPNSYWSSTAIILPSLLISILVGSKAELIMILVKER
jgi:hypothetical protein